MLKILKGEKAFKEEMEELEEPLSPESSPDPTSEEIPAEKPSTEEEPIMDTPPIEEDPPGIDPKDSFYPENENYDYAPDVLLTGNPNDGIIYPAGSESPLPTKEIVPEGDLGLEEKTMKETRKETQALDTDKVLTYKEAIAIVKENIAKSKAALVAARKIKEDLAMEDETAAAEDMIEDEMPAVGDEMIDDEMGVEEEITPEQRLDTVMSDLSVIQSELFPDEEMTIEDDEMTMEDDEMIDDESIETDNDLLEKKADDKDSLKEEEVKARLRRKAALKEKIKAKIAARRLKEEDIEEAPEEAPEEMEENSDVFYNKAIERSKKRKAYLKKIINEEDTPIMSAQSEVEELMGLKIIKKIGEDPKLVESKSKKFEENYKEKKSFDFKKLLENGFLG